jgi:hypothetical protein
MRPAGLVGCLLQEGDLGLEILLGPVGLDIDRLLDA